MSNPVPIPTRNAPRRPAAAAVFLALAAAAAPASAQSWSGYSKDAQHSSVGMPAQVPQKVYWAADVDVPNGARSGYTHYGSPIITRANHVIFPSTDPSGQTDLVTVHAVNPTPNSPTPIWSFTSDYIFPAHNWVPAYGITLTPKDARVVMPGAGGTIWVMDNPDRVGGTTPYQVAFYDDVNLSRYNANKAAFQQNVFICTPITSDATGNLYFGFLVVDSTNLGLPLKSGLAKLTLPRITNGTFRSLWTSAGAATAAAPGGTLTNGVYGPDPSIQKVAFNCAPALSHDGTTVYVGVNNLKAGNSGFAAGGLVALNSANLAPKAYVACKDPVSGTAALVIDDSTACPTVGPDGDVYFGVLEDDARSNNDRGWLLHYSADLLTTKVPGSFGWDDTASVVAASAVPSYSGTSSYLLLTKYNNYADPGIDADGMNKLAILDPHASQSYTNSGGGRTIKATTMLEVMTVLGPTKNTELNTGVREWCINSAAVDVANKAAIVNSEDGHLYRWSFVNNTLSPGLTLEQGTGEPYTPTVIGPDGAVYAINRSVLHCCVAAPSPGVVVGGPISPLPKPGQPTKTPIGTRPAPPSGPGATPSRPVAPPGAPPTLPRAPAAGTGRGVVQHDLGAARQD